MNNKIKILFIILAIVLITIIAFMGIYSKGDFKYNNVLPDYKKASSLDKRLVAKLKLNNSTETLDENGNKVDTSNTTENENNTTTETPVNSEDVKTVENYNLCKEIIEKRFKELKLTDYYVRVNDETGEITLDFGEEDNTEAAIYYSTYKGTASFEEENNNAILTNSDFNKIEFSYTQNSSNAYQVYLTVSLNKDGQEKINKYKEEAINTENATQESTEENTQEAEVSTEKKLSFKFEGEEVGTILVSEITDNKQLKINVGTASTNSTTINNNLNEAAVVSILVNSGEMPIKYEVENKYEIMSDITDSNIAMIIYSLLGLFAVLSLITIIRNVKDGILLLISNIGAISMFMILVRYTNVAIGTESFLVFALLEIILGILTFKISNKLKGKNSEEEVKVELKNIYKELITVFVLCLVATVVFSFASWAQITNIGVTIFWGIVSILISHFAFARTILINKRK